MDRIQAARVANALVNIIGDPKRETITVEVKEFGARSVVFVYRTVDSLRFAHLRIDSALPSGAVQDG